MAPGDIRIAWDTKTQRLCALHPADAAFGRGIAAFSFVPLSDLPEEMARRCGDQILPGPTLDEIRAALGET